jgi:hypothetical protein
MTVWATFLAMAGVSCARPSTPASSETEIVASDYTFQVPAHFPQGPVTFRLKNTGNVPHEVAMGQLRAGVTVDSVLARLASGGDPTDLTDGVVGILIAGPGATSLGRLAVELIHGRTYLMICQFKDADSLPPHIAMGMQASFVVD